MKEERINPNFNINAKYESMIEEANKIIKVYLETTNLYEEDGRYNLAYDVKNYLPKLLEENKSLQSQLKAKEEENEQLKADYGNLAQVERDLLKEVIKEIIEYLQSKEFKENFPYEANECQVRGYILNIVDKERTNENID